MSSDDDSDRDTIENVEGKRQPMEHCEATSSRTAEESSASRLGTETQNPAKGAAGYAVDEVECSRRLENQEVFFTTTDFYLALRMHHLLAGRLTEAKRLCREAKSSRQAIVASPHEVTRDCEGTSSVSLFRSNYIFSFRAQSVLSSRVYQVFSFTEYVILFIFYNFE